MNDTINILIEETNQSISIAVEESTTDVNIQIDEVTEEINIVVEDVGIKGNDGLGAGEAEDIRNRLDILEVGVADTDFDFRTEINTFLSF